MARISLPTDFERYGIAGRRLPIADRAWLLTIDFEAFAPGTIEEWLAAMRQWASLSAQGGWRFSIFLAIEDVVHLRTARRRAFDEFLRIVKDLAESGTTFHPHNHGVFDPNTGALAGVQPQHVAGYRKRASFGYDVVHRHRQGLSKWIGCVLTHYEEFLADAGIHRPHRLAFRAGGWDHGDTAEMARAYVRALDENGFSFDSSASSGVFGTESWRVGAPFGSNVFALSPSLVEVAPCWSFNCDVPIASRAGAAAVSRLLHQPQLWLLQTRGGAFVTVLHFDHLFRVSGRPLTQEMAPRASVEERVKRVFKMLSALRKMLHLDSATFEDLRIGS